MPPLDEALHNERLALITGFILRSVADRARAVERAQAEGTGPGAPSCRPSGSCATWWPWPPGMATAPPVDE